LVGKDWEVPLTPWLWETPFHKFNGCKSGIATDLGLNQVITGVFRLFRLIRFRHMSIFRFLAWNGHAAPLLEGSGMPQIVTLQHQRVNTRSGLIQKGTGAIPAGGMRPVAPYPFMTGMTGSFGPSVQDECRRVGSGPSGAG